MERERETPNPTGETVPAKLAGGIVIGSVVLAVVLVALFNGKVVS